MQRMSLERSCLLKAAICRQSSVLHCENTPAVGACPPTPVWSIMVWLIHIDREATVHTLSVSMETAS